jgi:hypothetical protein
MSHLRIIDDVIEMDGQVVATLVPRLRLSLRDQLAEAFALAGEDEETIAELEARVAKLKTRLKETAR